MLATLCGGALALVFARALVRRARRIDLYGKVAIVTGGSRGLGLLIAEEMGRRGARVAICGREAAAVERASAMLSNEGIEVLARSCDLGDRHQAEAFVREVEHHYGRIDVLVNNAGIIRVAPVSAMSADDVDDAMHASFASAQNMSFAALPALRRQRGEARIANVTSIGGRVAVPHLLGYSAAKFALIGFSEGLSAELAKEGIRVTTVVPWLMRTGSFYNAEMGGDRAAELAWFSAGSSLPLVTIDARRAARAIVAAVEEGQPFLTLGLFSKLASLVHGVMPGLVVRMMGIMNRLLPEADGQRGAAKGRDVDAPWLASRLFSLGNRAAHQNNEEPPSAPIAHDGERRQ